MAAQVGSVKGPSGISTDGWVGGWGQRKPRVGGECREMGETKRSRVVVGYK